MWFKVQLTHGIPGFALYMASLHGSSVGEVLTLQKRRWETSKIPCFAPKRTAGNLQGVDLNTGHLALEHILLANRLISSHDMRNTCSWQNPIL